MYCDSSFLCSLYLPGEKYEPLARSLAANLSAGIPFPALAELELCNSVYRACARKLFNLQTCNDILRRVRKDCKDGVLVPVAIAWEEHFKEALELTTQFTLIHQCRTLDVLHVAAAMLVRSPSFASFDTRQRKLAADVGLKLLPEQL